MNHAYYRIFSGEFTLESDFRKPVRVKESKRLEELRAKAHGSVLSQCRRDVNIPKDLKWTIILLCTDGDSLMYHVNPFPEHCRVVHITEQIDLTSESGYQYVLDLIGRTENLMMLASSPCTGGCLFNVGINSKRPECKAN